MKNTQFVPMIGVATVLWAGFLTWKSTDSMPKQISVGEHSLRVLVQGQGSPAVVFETFGAGFLEHMNKVEPHIRRFTTTVVYDHAGAWGSEPGPKPRDANQIARELHTLLKKSDVSPPYLLVGFSFGGPYVRVFADRYPENVAGLVLVDPTQESFMSWLRESWPEVNVLTEAQRREQTEWGSQWVSMNQASNAVLPNVPMVLLTGMKTGDSVFARHVKPRWLSAHQEWLTKYPNALHIVTTNSGHGIPMSEPELVVEAINHVFDEAKVARE